MCFIRHYYVTVNQMITSESIELWVEEEEEEEEGGVASLVRTPQRAGRVTVDTLRDVTGDL